MKKLILILAAMVIVAVGVQAQGTVNFSNNGLGAPVFNTDGVTPLEGDGFQAILYAGAMGSDPSSFQPVGASTAFLSGTLAGVFFGGERAIPGIAGGSQADLQVRAWDASTGSDWDAAGIKGSSDPVTITLGSAGSSPVQMNGLESFNLVPEPSTIALGLLGAAALVFVRRRK